jgi:hypothetical protein
MVSNLLNLKINEKKFGILLLNQGFDPLSNHIMNFAIPNQKL